LQITIHVGTQLKLCSSYISAEFHHYALRYVKDYLTTPQNGAPALVPGLKRLIPWTDGHTSTYWGYPNHGRMAYAALQPSPAGSSPAGFEYAMGIEIRHCKFVEYHACGAQDAVGKAARQPLLKAIGFKTSIYNYHECWLWSKLHQAAPKQRTRDGDWSANGSYVWLALSDGKDSHCHEHPVLDMRTKKFRPVKGSSETNVVWARDTDGSNTPKILSRRYWCVCVGCRSGAGCWNPEIHGEWKVHSTPIIGSLSVEASAAKKAEDKIKRQASRAKRAASLRQNAAPSVGVAVAVAAVVEAAAEGGAADLEENVDVVGAIEAQALYESSENEEVAEDEDEAECA
jgi:hypothetical protein